MIPAKGQIWRASRDQRLILIAAVVGPRLSVVSCDARGQPLHNRCHLAFKRSFEDANYGHGFIFVGVRPAPDGGARQRDARAAPRRQRRRGGGA